MKMRVLLLASLTFQQLMAAPPDLPAFVADYFERAGLDYDIPQGRFEDYLLTVIEEENQPEPWAIVADFNGDKISDWSGLVRDREGHLALIVVYSDRRDFSHQLLTPLGSDGNSLATAVVLEPAGQIIGFPFGDNNERPTIKITNPAVHLLYFEKASVLYYWEDAQPDWILFCVGVHFGISGCVRVSKLVCALCGPY